MFIPLLLIHINSASCLYTLADNKFLTLDAADGCSDDVMNSFKKEVTHIVLGENLTYLATKFSEWEKLERVADYCGLASELFKDCKSLKLVKLGKNVGTISSSSFEGCSSLETVYILGNVSFIDEKAFSGSVLENLYYLGDRNPNVFDSHLKDLKTLEEATVLNSYKDDNFAGVKVKKVSSIDIPDDFETSGLSAGAIVGIVIGCIAGVALIVVGVVLFFYIKKKRAEKPFQAPLVQ